MHVLIYAVYGRSRDVVSSVGCKQSQAMSSQQRRERFTDEHRSSLQQPLIGEDEDENGAREPRVMEESGLGSLRHPVTPFVRGSTFEEEEAVEKKACSDPNLQDHKEHSFAFKSEGKRPTRSCVPYRKGTLAIIIASLSGTEIEIVILNSAYY